VDLERYFMRVLSKQKGVRLALTPEAERTLLGYSFPNNIVVREGRGEKGIENWVCEAGVVNDAVTTAEAFLVTSWRRAMRAAVVVLGMGVYMLWVEVAHFPGRCRRCRSRPAVQAAAGSQLY
jgi:transcriptional regulator with GAF, ATPase, and Fis domain